MKCKEDGCEKVSRAKGYCQKHYDKHWAAPWRRYRLTREEMDRQLAIQGYKCALGGIGQCSPSVFPRDVDHDHKTGELRALLCHRHNMMLGYLEGKDGLANLDLVFGLIKQYVSGELVSFLVQEIDHEIQCEHVGCANTFHSRRDKRYCSKKCSIRARYARWARLNVGQGRILA